MYNDSASGEAQHTCISCLEPDDRCEVATATIDTSMHWSVGLLVSCVFLSLILFKKRDLHIVDEIQIIINYPLQDSNR